MDLPGRLLLNLLTDSISYLNKRSLNKFPSFLMAFYLGLPPTQSHEGWLNGGNEGELIKLKSVEATVQQLYHSAVGEDSG